MSAFAFGRSESVAPEPAPELDRMGITFEEFTSRQQRMPISSGGEPGIEVSYTDIGPASGDAVVLVHGVPTSSWMYRYVLDALDDTGLRVIAIDNPGYGTSGKPEMEVDAAASFYEPARQAERVRAVLDALAIERAVFVVHDVGGPIVWELLEDEPEIAAGLVVLNTIGAPGGFSPPAAVDSRIVQAVINSVAFTTDESIRSLICPMVAVPEKIDTPLQLEGYYAPFREGADIPYKAFLSSLDLVRARLASYASIIERLDVPAGLYWGEQDVDLLADPSARWFVQALGIPGDRVTTDATAKHLVAEEAPREIAALITEVARLAF